MTSKNPSNELQTDATANNLPHNAMDYLQEGCVIIGRNRRYLYVNDAAARHGRTTKESLVGRPVLEAYPGLERTQWQDLLEECMESRVTQRFEYEFEYSDGEKKWFEFRFEPVPHGVFVLSVDITQRRQDQEQLRVSRKLEALGRLTGGIAHDFNNILTVILNCTDFALKDLDESERRHRDINEIGKAAGRAASLTRQLLAFSRRQVMKPEIVDLNEVLTNMRHMLQRLIGEDITIKSQLAEDLGKSSLDPSQIEQVIMNLVI
ncbi:PAS domain-containing protein, partial [bacterium]|nr:PAS domain-containing protein [bacterium]